MHLWELSWNSSFSILDTYKGEVSIIGTPAEETGDGKPYLIEHGVFDGYDAAMMIHPNSKTCVAPEIIAIGGLDFIFTGKHLTQELSHITE